MPITRPLLCQRNISRLTDFCRVGSASLQESLERPCKEFSSAANCHNEKEELLKEIKELRRERAVLLESLKGSLEGALRNLKDKEVDKYLDNMGSSVAALDTDPYVMRHKGQWPAHFLQFVGLTMKITGEATVKKLAEEAEKLAEQE